MDTVPIYDDPMHHHSHDLVVSFHFRVIHPGQLWHVKIIRTDVGFVSDHRLSYSGRTS